MGLPNVNITIANGQLGRVAAVDDSVAGLILSGTATEDLALSNPVQLFSFDKLSDYGITEANNPLAYKEVKAFYDQAGEGSELWLMLISDAVLFADMCDETENYAKKMLDTAQGRIRLLGANRIPAAGYEPTIVENLDSDVVTALTNLETMAGHYGLAYKPFRALLPGLGFTKASVATLKDLKQSNKNHVAIVLGCDSDEDWKAAIGLTLGRLAKIPVQRSIARVKDGDVGIDAAYFPDGTPVEELESNWDSIHNKGYIFFRRIYGKSGYFFTDDPTATADTDDYCFIARGRVIDKALVIAYKTFIEELNDEIPVDEVTGKVSPALVASWETNIEQALGINMTAKKEIVKAQCAIDPNQDVLSTDKIYAKIRITPVGYAKAIEVTLGLSNPYKAA